MRTSKKLDPRLRRLVASRETLVSMETAVGHGEIISMSSGHAASTLNKRVLIELNETISASEALEKKWTHVAGNIYTASVALDRLELLAEEKEVESIEAGRKWYPMLDTSLSEAKIDFVHTGLGGVTARTGAGVVVGIIDFGMDFTLDDFRSPDGTTRLAFLWDQIIEAHAGESCPTNFPYGVEYTADDINDALSNADPFSVVRHNPGPASHGTHVAGTAAGNGRSKDAEFAEGKYVGAAPGATIIFVQPNSSDQNSSFTDSSNVADAVAYIYEKAAELGLPCVINMSLGQNGGSHDGESLVERAIDRLLESSRRAFVSAAGNEHVWRGHASGNLAPGDTRSLSWKVGGGMPVPGGGATGTGRDRTPSEMEIWYSSRDRFRVTITDPNDVSSQPLEPGQDPIFENLNNDTNVFVDSERFTIFNGDSRIYIQLEPSNAGNSVTRGVWTVTVEALESTSGRFDAWIERDLRDPDNNFADQSFFVGTDFDPVQTLGTPATTRRALAIANYDHRTQALNDSSSRGPTRSNMNKPEIAAPGTEILASHSLGGRPGPGGILFPMRVGKSGTSMSAPHVTGGIALLMEENSGLSSSQITKLLIATSEHPDRSHGFDAAWGYGRLNIRHALALLRNPNQPALGGGPS